MRSPPTPPFLSSLVLYFWLPLSLLVSASSCAPDSPNASAFYAEFLALDQRIDDFKTQLFPLAVTAAAADILSENLRMHHLVHSLVHSATIQLHLPFSAHSEPSRAKCLSAAMGIVDANVEARMDGLPCVHPLLAVSLVSFPADKTLNSRHGAPDDMVGRVSCVHRQTCVTASAGCWINLHCFGWRTRTQGSCREGHYRYDGLRCVFPPHEYVSLSLLCRIGGNGSLGRSLLVFFVDIQLTKVQQAYAAI